MDVKQYPTKGDDNAPPTSIVLLRSMRSIIFAMLLSVLFIHRDDNNIRTIPTMLSVLLIRRDGNNIRTIPTMISWLFLLLSQLELILLALQSMHDGNSLDDNDDDLLKVIGTIIVSAEA